MGQAKARGTYEQRKAAAVAEVKRLRKLREEHRPRRPRQSLALAAVLGLAAGALEKKS